MSAALDQAFETQRLRLVETVTRTAVATWDLTFHEREAATAQMVQLVEAGTGQMAALVDAYMTASLREAGENVAPQGEAGGGYTVQELRGVPGDAVYDRPFGAIGGQLEEGAEFAVAMEASRERLRREIRTDLQLAQVKAAQALVTGDNGIAGWRRAVVGTCAYCAAHNDEYRGEDPMPIHQNCRCGVAPVIQDRKITNKTESVKDDELGHVLDKTQPPAYTEAQLDDALEYYHSPQAFELNDKLRRGAELTAEEKEVVRVLDAAMGELPFDAELFRGVPDVEEVFGMTLDEIQALAGSGGKEWSQKSFMSTSNSWSAADDFATGISFGDQVPVILKIRAPAGTRALRVPAGDYGDQDEWLLPRGLKLIIDGLYLKSDPPTIFAHLAKK